MHFAIIVSLLAGITQIYGYWLYNKGIYQGKIKPNATSWGLWAFGSIISCWAYLKLVDNDLVKGFLPIACCLVCIGTFFLALSKGKFERPDRESVLIALLDVAIVAFSLVTDAEATHTNVLVQMDVVLSFVPIVRETWKNPRAEEPKPWFVWCAAYALFFIAVILSWEKWWDIIYPVNYFVLHMVVGLIAKYRTARA